MATATNGQSGLTQGRIGRVKILEELDGFIQTSENHLNDVLSKIGWTRESLQEESLSTCTHDHHHLMPESSLSKHVALCQWLKEGYSRKDYIETNSSAFFYRNTNSVFSVTVDQETQNKILSQANGCPTVKPVPRTPERACTGFSQKEKLAIYDYVVAESQRSRASSSSSKFISEVGEDLDSSQGTKKGDGNAGKRVMSRLEMLKQMRDYKRRRQSYRAKNVHITKRSQTDIMREIIKNQMEELEAERQSSDLIREATNCDSPVRNEEKVKESSTGNNGMEGYQSGSRYPEESIRKPKETTIIDQRSRDHGDNFRGRSDKGQERYQETNEFDRYDGTEGRGNSREKDYEREAREVRRRESTFDRGRGGCLNLDAKRCAEMAQSYDGSSTRSASPADVSERTQGRHKHSSKHKKHKHHYKHKTRD